jgi:uncharacterized membrane protein
MVFGMVGLASVAGSVATAQPGWGGRGGGFNGRGPDAFGGGAGFGTGLNYQQQQVFQEALQKDNDKLRALEDQLRAAQKQLLQAALKSPFDDTVVSSNALVYTRIQSEIAQLRSRALAVVAQKLEAADKTRLADSPLTSSLLASSTAGGGQNAGWGGPGAGGPGGGGPGGFGGPGGGRGGFNGPGAGFGGPGGGGFGSSPLGNEERQAFEQALQKDAVRLRSMSANLQVVQNDLVDSVLAPAFDTKTVQEKAEALANIQSGMEMVRAKALAAAVQSMSAAERQQLVDSPATLQLLTDSSVSMGGGRGGPGGFPGGRNSTPNKER